MSIEIKVNGLKELKDRFKDLDEEARKRVAQAINTNAIEFHRKVRNSLKKRHGRHRQRWYWGKGRKGKKKGVRRGISTWSSTPGKPPNPDTGKLAESIEITRFPNTNNPVAFIKAGGSGAKYAKALEKSRNRNMRRPFMGPMYRKLYPVFVKRIRQAIKGAL